MRNLKLRDVIKFVPGHLHGKWKGQDGGDDDDGGGNDEDS